MNLEAIQRDTVKEAVRALVLAGGALALYIGLSTWNASVQEENARLQSAYGQAQSEIALLRSKVESAGTSGKSFADLVQARGNANFEIDNSQVRDVLQTLVARYRINFEGKLEYSAQQNFESPALQNLINKFIVRREAKINFTAITDQHVYSFLDELSRELPGIMRYSKLTIRRTSEADPSVIANLSGGNASYLVTADVTFDWYGIVAPDAPAQTQGGAL
jgi:hypothetical protein